MLHELRIHRYSGWHGVVGVLSILFVVAEQLASFYAMRCVSGDPSVAFELANVVDTDGAVLLIGGLLTSGYGVMFVLLECRLIAYCSAH